MKTTIFILVFCLTVSLSSCAQQPSKTFDEGVVINGIRWAIRNVATPGTFADKPEDVGMFYQWNRKKAWNATDSIVAGWDTSIPEGNEWEKANDPSPKGWRIPTAEEFESLLDEEKVSNEWITQNGINGRKFTDKENGNSIFLPAAGYRGSVSGKLLGISLINSGGHYWSRMQNDTSFAYSMFVDEYYAGDGAYDRRVGYTLRCVAE